MTASRRENRRHTAPEAVIGSIDDHIAWLDEQTERLDRGRRAIWGGRSDARAMLFLAAQSAARWNARCGSSTNAWSAAGSRRRPRSLPSPARC
jgi:hypothetical protein